LSGDIGRDIHDGDTRALTDRFCRLTKRVLAPRTDDEICSFSGKLFGDRATETFAAGGYQSDLAAKTEIQGQRLR